MSGKPKEYAVGDRVVNPSRPQWGVGTVTHVQGLGEIVLWNGKTFHTYIYDRKTMGQRLDVRFADGRTRTIISSNTTLRPAPASE